MRQLIVFSLDLANSPALESDRQTVVGLLTQSGIAVRPALGVYNGKSENSFIAEVSDKNQAALVRSIALHYIQESILSVDVASSEASLHFLKGKPKRKILGHWIKTSKIDKNAMTIDLTDMQGYIVK